MNTVIISILILALVAAPTAAHSSSSLKALAKKHGVDFGAFYQYDIRGDRYNTIFAREMKVMTLGAFWKSDIRWTRDDFNLSELDAKVNWGRKHNMELYGQTLIWFDDVPNWLEDTSNDEVEDIMNEHIDTVVGRYAGQIKAWNVVNEAIDSDGTVRQDHKWAEAMGEDYISKSFIRAHAADPNAILYYNDFDIESNKTKFEGVKQLLIDLKEQDVPVDALGWQMHIFPRSFNANTVLKRMNEIADLGFDNYITELDVALPVHATTADYKWQKKMYKKVVRTFLAARRNKILVVWGLRDGDPWWLTKKHPLLFNKKLEKKPAYFGVHEALQ